MTHFNGYKNWNHWSVARAICDNTKIARRATILMQRLTKDETARELLQVLPSSTPEGAPYTFNSVRAALVDLEKM